MIKKSIYTVGGTVQAGGGHYIQRRADEELLKLCLEGVFAYVLTSRQLGKSSLMVRTAEQLIKQGGRTVIIDLTQLGVQVTSETWYLGLLTTIADELSLEGNIVNWWQSRKHLGFTQRLILFLQEVVLTEIKDRVVIFVDEIDSTLSLEFTDDFFAAIRYLYNARATIPDYQRLSFVLIGVATPSDLISDPHRTPFNIGQRVDLTDFTYEETLPLAKGLDLRRDNQKQVLKWVLNWTGGHPYLTQRLCRAIAEQYRSHWSEQDVEATVSSTFFGKMSEQDTNLQFIRDMLTKRAPDRLKVMSVYREIRLKQRQVEDDEQSPIKNHLKLSGVVHRVNGRLQVRNAIYENVFDRRWLKEHWPTTWLATVPKSVKIASGIILFLLVVSILLSITALKLVEREREAKEDLQTALVEKEEAIQKETEARKREIDAHAATNLQRQKAESATAEAQKLAVKEMKARKAVEIEKAKADSLTWEEKRARQLSEEKSAENRRLRLIEIARNLAIQAPLSKQPNDSERDLLLARQAYLFNKKNKGTLKQEIYDALRITLNNFNGSGGPTILRGHQFGVRAVTFHPNGKLIASASEDKTVKIWDIDRPGEPSKTYTNHESAVISVVFSPDGQFLISASHDKNICMRKLGGTLVEPELLIKHMDWINAIAIGPESHTLASIDRDKTLRLWDVQHPSTEPTRIIQHSSQIRAIAFHPDGKSIATAGDDKQIHIWSLPNPGEKPEQQFDQDDRIFAVAFSPNGKWLASGSYDGKIGLWNLMQPNSDPETIPAHEGKISALAFSPDSRMLASGSKDRSVKLWDLQLGDNKLILEFDHTDWDWVWAIAFSPDGKTLVTACEDRAIRIWATGIDLLAEKVCGIVTRNLTQNEWNRFVGSDIPREPTCPNLPLDNSAQITTSKNSH